MGIDKLEKDFEKVELKNIMFAPESIMLEGKLIGITGWLIDLFSRKK